MNKTPTLKQIRIAEKWASTHWHKYTDNGAHIHPMWWTEYIKKLNELMGQ